jgi:hypothetical protein
MDRPLTAVERERLRDLIDRARRAAINWQSVMRCRGCGIEQRDAWTGEPRYLAGCSTCSDRRSKHRARERRGSLKT